MARREKAKHVTARLRLPRQFKPEPFVLLHAFQRVRMFEGVLELVVTRLSVARLPPSRVVPCSHGKLFARQLETIDAGDVATRTIFRPVVEFDATTHVILHEVRVVEVAVDPGVLGHDAPAPGSPATSVARLHLHNEFGVATAEPVRAVVARLVGQLVVGVRARHLAALLGMNEDIDVLVVGQVHRDEAEALLGVEELDPSPELSTGGEDVVLKTDHDNLLQLRPKANKVGESFPHHEEGRLDQALAKLKVRELPMSAR